MRKFVIVVEVDDKKFPEFEAETGRWKYLMGPTGPMCDVVSITEAW